MQANYTYNDMLVFIIDRCAIHVEEEYIFSSGDELLLSDFVVKSKEAAAFSIQPNQKRFSLSAHTRPPSPPEPRKLPPPNIFDRIPIPTTTTIGGAHGTGMLNR